MQLEEPTLYQKSRGGNSIKSTKLVRKENGCCSKKKAWVLRLSTGKSPKAFRDEKQACLFILRNGSGAMGFLPVLLRLTFVSAVIEFLFVCFCLGGGKS